MARKSDKSPPNLNPPNLNPPDQKPADTRPETAASPRPDPRDAFVDALMRLAARRDWDDIELADIAQEAGLTLADLRAAFPSKGAILGGLSRRIDMAVLKGDGGEVGELADEPPRERLFDVFMRRFDALAPYKTALRRISPALRRDPLAMLALNQGALNSQRFMLASAGISTEDGLGGLKLQGAVLVFANAFETWLDDDDPGLAATMARLDKELKRGHQVMKRAQDLYRLTAPLRAFGRAICERRPRDRRRERAGEGMDGDDYAPAI
jgi:AcrR family transcriptional regulator